MCSSDLFDVSTLKFFENMSFNEYLNLFFTSTSEPNKVDTSVIKKMLFFSMLIKNYLLRLFVIDKSSSAVLIVLEFTSYAL